MSANAVVTLGQRVTLADLLQSCETAHNMPARRRECAVAIRHDLALLQELFSAEDVEARLRALLVERSAQEISIKVTDAGVRPLQVVREHVKRRPVVPTRASLDARKATQKHMAAVVLMIDGVDLPLWTVGQCRSAVRRKGRETRILSRVAEMLHDKNDCDTVAQWLPREVLCQIVAENL